MTAPAIYSLHNADGRTIWRGTITPTPGGGSQPGALAMRRSAVFGHDEVNYVAGSGLFDTGLTLAQGEELLLWYVHVPEPWAALGHSGTDFTFGGYLGPTGEGDSLNNGGVQDGSGDNILTQSQLTEVIGSSNPPGYAAFIAAETITVDTPVFGYVSGPDVVLTAGKIQYVLIVAAAS